jgi:hypothetical protein
MRQDGFLMGATCCQVAIVVNFVAETHLMVTVALAVRFSLVQSPQLVQPLAQLLPRRG